MNIHTNYNFKIYREDWYILIIFCMMAIAIISKSYFDTNGYLSPDSTNYLKLAQNLLEGKGYYVSAYGNTGQTREFFAIWPAGYPTFIFIIAKLTGLSVFWASKFLNILLIGIILGIFRVFFKHDAYIYGLIILFAAYIEIFTYTWSETIFITALIWFATSVYLFILNPKRITLLYFSIMMSSLLLFMSRYIGAFSFGIIGLLGLYYGFIKKNRITAMILIGITIVNISIMILYLYHNYTETGYPTGMKRIPSPETNIQLLIRLMDTLASEITIPIAYISYKWFALQFSILFFIIIKFRRNILNMFVGKRHSPVLISIVFTLIGFVYLFFIILMRWISQFDPYGYRLLAPGSFLIFVGIIFFIQQRGIKQFLNAFKGFLLVFAIISYLLSISYSIMQSSKFNPSYFQTIKTLEEKYADVEKNSIVIFAPRHIRYLYTDIQTRRPYFTPYAPYKESWFDFIQRISSNNNKNIYLHIPKKELSSKYFDKSVIDFIKKYDKDTLVKLR